MGHTDGKIIGGFLFQLESLPSQPGPNLAVQQEGAAGQIGLVGRDVFSCFQFRNTKIEFGLSVGFLAEQFLDPQAIPNFLPGDIIFVDHELTFFHTIQRVHVTAPFCSEFWRTGRRQNR